MGSVYTLIPRPVGSFAGLDMTARYAFGLVFDRWQLSKKDSSGKFKDEHGIYCVYSREAMAAEMGVSLPTLRTAMTHLTKRGLINSRLVMKGGALRYYIPSTVIKELGADKAKRIQKDRDDRSGYNPKTGDCMQRKSKEEIALEVAAAILDFDDL